MGKFTEYNLPIKSLPKGKHEYDFKLSKKFFDDMECNDVRDADLNAHVTVVYENDFYDIDFLVTGSVTVPCDRCLDDLVLPVDATYHLIVKYGDDYSESNDELLVLPMRDTTLNIAYMLADTVMLAIPLKHVHPLGKCNRSMSALLKKHKIRSDEDSDLENELIDEVDSLDDSIPTSNERSTDPRWNGLKGLADSMSEPDVNDEN